VRVTELEARLYRIPPPIRIQDSIQRVAHWEWIVTTLTTESGLRGTGVAYTNGFGRLEREHRLAGAGAFRTVGAPRDDCGGVGYGSNWLRGEQRFEHGPPLVGLPTRRRGFGQLPLSPF
jgi:hypothetical protein